MNPSESVKSTTLPQQITGHYQPCIYGKRVTENPNSNNGSNNHTKSGCHHKCVIKQLKSYFLHYY